MRQAENKKFKWQWNKKQQEKFIKMTHTAINALKLCPKRFQSDDYAVMTTYGRLDINVFNDWIATRFECPELAKAYADCNPYSGKWNFHFNNTWDPETAVFHFMALLQPILMEA